MGVSRRSRLDAELVKRTIATSRQEACELIEAGRVLVNGSVAAKPSHQVLAADAIVVEGPPRKFVSRGGEKLEKALEEFGISVVGRRALDAGASTGGFTDCLLHHGIAHVVAVDVGHGQLHPRIRHDERVTVLERHNVKSLDPADIGGLLDIAVADLSFISLTSVVGKIVALVHDGGDLVLLVKPQFEVGRKEASRGKGVITDTSLHEWACEKVSQACIDAGAEVVGLITSPILGGAGNKEFLLHAIRRERLNR